MWVITVGTVNQHREIKTEFIFARKLISRCNFYRNTLILGKYQFNIKLLGSLICVPNKVFWKFMKIKKLVTFFMSKLTDKMNQFFFQTITFFYFKKNNYLPWSVIHLVQNGLNILEFLASLSRFKFTAVTIQISVLFCQLLYYAQAHSV